MAVMTTGRVGYEVTGRVKILKLFLCNIKSTMLNKRFKNDGVPTIKLNELQLKSRDIVNQKVSDNVYAFEEVNCAVCDNRHFELISEKDRYGLEMKIVICKDCGLVQTNPRMTQESYNDFYNTEYRPLYVGKNKPTALFFQRQYERGKTMYEYLKANNALPTKENPFLLEVGCGAGGILQYFKEQGFKTFGTDLGTSYLEYGRSKGLELASGFLRDQKLDQQPDLIIYSHVVEHLLDPNEEISYLKEIAHQDTVLYIEVPGVLNLKKPYKHNYLRYVQNAHTYHFSLDSLTNLLAKNNFKVVAGTEYIRSISRMTKDTSEKRPTKNCYDDTISYLKELEKGRSNIPFYPYPVSGYWVKEEIKQFMLNGLDTIGVRPYIKKIRKQISK